MTYSCCDFVDSVMGDLTDRGLLKEEDLPDGDDNVSQLADLALAVIARLLEENGRLKAENLALRIERANKLADAERVCAWIDDPSRKRAVLAFTEGAERQIAYRFEGLLRGEYICPKCGLRKDGAAARADF